ncbi:MAG: hypothetical protein J1G04_01675 [Clostridiales bacterium]|nr:hypothetical protein [Clostridiales bacterium]
MKQKVLLTMVESGFGHISSMESIYDYLQADYGDTYDVEKSFIMQDPDLPHLNRLERWIVKQVQNTNKFAWFGDFVFFIIKLLGSHHIMRFVHRQIAYKAFREGLEAIDRRNPDVIITNHYFSNMLAVEYKRRINPSVVIINYNPDCTLHTFWDRRDGIFIVNNEKALARAIKYKFDEDKLRLVNPCVRKSVEDCDLTREQLREKHGLPQDKFTVAIADGGYMMGRGAKFARAIIKKDLPITLCILAGKNEERYKEFVAIAEGKGKIKAPKNTTIKVYKFTEQAHELYGAADLFLTKGGPNAVLDSIYMNTPVMVDFCPHLIEKWTVKIYIDMLGCGERAFSPKKAIKRITCLMENKSDLERYAKNIAAFTAEGNGASGVAKIIDEEAAKQRADKAQFGIVYDCDKLDERAKESAKAVLDETMTSDGGIVPQDSEDIGNEYKKL